MSDRRVRDAIIPRELRAWRAWGVARRMERGVRDPRFRELVQRIDGGPLHLCPSVTLLPDGEEAFARMRDAIESAREEVLLETYILRDDQLGESVRQALIAAAGRGLRVCVLADAVGSMSTADGFWRSLEQGGAQVRLFHRVWLHPLEALRRDHRKLLVVDRRLGFTGGMNIGEEYGSSVVRRRHVDREGWRDAWRDTFIALRGTVVRELAAVFAEGWDRAGGPDLPGLEYVSWADGVVQPPRGWRGTMTPRAWQSRWQLQRGHHRDRVRGRRVRRDAPPVTADAPAVIVMDPRPGRGQREMLTVLSALTGAARQRLWITTPYFAPPTRALELLGAAARRGVDVRLLLPGVRTDVPLVRHAAHGAYHKLLSTGVRIFEYDRAMLHAKTLVVDSHVGLVGSSNLDFRSFWLNAECNVLIFDDTFARELDASFLDDLEGSTEITPELWRRRTLTHRLLDRIARGLRWAL
ncbi:phospholipase D-like domain-containing protein [Gemmatimonas aurantiaca]|uniref:phospholipase D-like domain-containing protein n=1 Tax=Gemmatimonas aurantiaca TaxID=173480 RepID=UPI00301CF721